MKKLLITGFTGFVSKHLLELLYQSGNSYEIIGLSRANPDTALLQSDKVRINTVQVDLNDRQSISSLLGDFQPHQIIHLASDSSVAHSWQEPVESFQNNTNIFLNLVEGVRNLKFSCRILSIGSSEEYGVVDPKYIPIKEETPFHPVSPYAVARVSQELLSKIYSDGYGMDIVMTRSFNHIGPGQKENFVISSFARQIIAIKHKQQSTIKVGNVEVVRDFLDVRDVVKAYMLLLDKGKSGQVYNICSGKGYSLKDILTKMMSIAGVDQRYEVSEELIRPADNPVIIGSNEKINKECAWQPGISIEKSLEDVLNYWEAKLN
jgi:GDP-4-dehydro-6-deoxy-D-mannose reductase